ncbi:MAG: RNA polymerase sigma-70 factor [Bacteroidetes bacterium]|nr:RNA polymerase sigma-70 factor [Bacteroidota bacterium]
MEINDLSNIYISANTESVFEDVFKTHFKKLHAYAYTILKDEDEAEEIVQNVFFKLWEKKEKIGELQSIGAYLYRAVYNDSLNYLKHEKVKASHRAFAVHNNSEMDSSGTEKRTLEMERRLQEALNELPEQCRTIFQMSRFENMKYREIADKLELSVKTIENQMGKALKIMRVQLADLLPVLWIMLNMYL